MAILCELSRGVRPRVEVQRTSPTSSEDESELEGVLGCGELTISVASFHAGGDPIDEFVTVTATDRGPHAAVASKRFELWIGKSHGITDHLREKTARPA